MTESAFLQRLVAEVPPRLPAPLRHCQARARSRLAQFYYERPALHYEVWLHGASRRVEIGLHLEERDRRVNQALLALLVERLVAIKAALGPSPEPELWDRGWARLYETIPQPPLDDAFLDRVAARAAEWIATLQPMLRESDAGVLARRRR